MYKKWFEYKCGFLPQLAQNLVMGVLPFGDRIRWTTHPGVGSRIERIDLAQLTCSGICVDSEFVWTSKHGCCGQLRI